MELASFQKLFVFLFFYWCVYGFLMMSPMGCDQLWGTGTCAPIERWMTFFVGVIIFMTAVQFFLLSRLSEDVLYHRRLTFFVLMAFMLQLGALLLDGIIMEVFVFSLSSTFVPRSPPVMCRNRKIFISHKTIFQARSAKAG